VVQKRLLEVKHLTWDIKGMNYPEKVQVECPRKREKHVLDILKVQENG
jgi:hypothetical protein